MLSYQFYNLVHIFGLSFLMVGLGARALDGAAGRVSAERWPRALTGVFHGLGLFLILLGGFGMLARLGIVQGTSWPGWVWGKLAVWLLLGGAAALPYRFPAAARPLLLIVPLLGGLAAYLAIFKPI